MKVALFKNIDHGYDTVFECSNEEYLTGYARISEHVNVEFPPLSSDEHIQHAVSALDKQRAHVADEFGRKLADIDRRKSELLAITHQPASD